MKHGCTAVPGESAPVDSDDPRCRCDDIGEGPCPAHADCACCGERAYYYAEDDKTPLCCECAEADELRAEVARLTKLLDVCDVTHAHNVALKDERGLLRVDVARLLLLLGRVVKYVVEDRATTPGSTRLARLVDEIRVELQHAGALEEDARLVATSKIQTKEPDETDDQYRSR